MFLFIGEMAYSNTPDSLASKSVRWNLSRQQGYQEEAKEKFKPSKELFCSKCLARGKVLDAFAFCKICHDFMCGKCTEIHESTLLTLNHGILVGNEMVSRYQRAMKDSKQGGQTESRGQVDKVADGQASFRDKVLDKGTVKTTRTQTATVETELSGEKRVRVDEDGGKCFICACVVYDDGKVVLADANNKCLKLFNRHFKCLFVFDLKQEPWDACKAIDFDSDLFVSEARIKGVHQFKVAKEIKYVFTLKTDGECFGLTHWKHGVAVSVKHNKQFSVKLMDKMGNIHRSITTGFEFRLKLDKPWYLASMRAGQYILISDSGTGMVTCIDVDKGIKFIYRNKRGLCDPRSICADDEGNIFVVDYETDTVCQLSSKGKDQGVMMCSLDGLASPCGLTCYDQQFYIQPKMDSNSIQIFDIL